jgi:hypothetical protein
MNGSARAQERQNSYPRLLIPGELWRFLKDNVEVYFLESTFTSDLYDIAGLHIGE